MSWWHNRYRSRPASKNKTARMVWDLMTREHAPRTIVCLHCADEMEAWVTHLSDDSYEEMDIIEVAWFRNRPDAVAFYLKHGTLNGWEESDER